MINPPPRQLLVTPKPCQQCGVIVREAWLMVGGRRRRRFRRVVVHNDPVGPLRLRATTVVEFVGRPADGLAGHEPNRYSLHRTATCDARSVPNFRYVDGPPYVGVAEPQSSAAGPRPHAADGPGVPPRTAHAHTAHGPAGAAPASTWGLVDAGAIRARSA